MEDKKIPEKDTKKRVYIEIGDNLYWLLFWFGIFILIFFGKC
jgi:hypothetical protein